MAVCVVGSAIPIPQPAAADDSGAATQAGQLLSGGDGVGRAVGKQIDRYPLLQAGEDDAVGDGVRWSCHHRPSKIAWLRIRV